MLQEKPNCREACLLFGLGFMKHGFPGIIPFSMARTVFKMPDIPADGPACPKLLFILTRIQ